jgi:heme-degrading monooxygenase HmoA
MEVLSSEGTEEADEVLVVTSWRVKAAFNSWVASEEEFCTLSALAAPRLTVTVK